LEDDGIEAAVQCETLMFGGTIRSSNGVRASDLALSPEREPPLGAHMVTPRRGYAHHGIYVGQGRVVQYGGLSLGLRRGPVEEVTLSQFAQGRPIWHRPAESLWFDRDEVVRRARMRLGENRYNVLTNNCEHFCEWCVRGEHRSYQVDDMVVRCSRAWRRLVEALGRSLFPRRGSADAH
jgi:Lecithin retinol acyltransferase